MPKRLALLLVQQFRGGRQAREAALAQAHDEPIGRGQPARQGGRQHADTARAARRPWQAGFRGQGAERALKLPAVQHAAAVVQQAFDPDPLLQLVPEALQGGGVPGVAGGPHAEVAREGPKPGDMFGQPAAHRGCVPGAKEPFQEAAAPFSQLVRPLPPRFLGLLVLQSRGQMFRPVRHGPPVSVAATRLGQEAQQRLTVLGYVRTGSRLGPVGAKIAAPQ